MMSEETALVIRNDKGQLLPGSPAVPGVGRPKGSRNRITKLMDQRYEEYLNSPAEHQQNWFILHPEDKTNPIIHLNWTMAFDEHAKKELRADCARNLATRYDEVKPKFVAAIPEPRSETQARTAKITAAIKGLFLEGLVQIEGPSHG